MTVIKHRISYVMKRYPAKCSECPCFSQHPYQCHNERGMGADCSLGYMQRHDTRDFSGRTRFFKCQIENSSRVTINPDL